MNLEKQFKIDIVIFSLPITSMKTLLNKKTQIIHDTLGIITIFCIRAKSPKYYLFLIVVVQKTLLKFMCVLYFTLKNTKNKS